MSDHDRNPAAVPRFGADRALAVDAGLRAHMIRVYHYMALGVALLGLVRLMALVGLVAASIVVIFLGRAQLQFIVSVVGVLVCAGLPAWDTQKIKEMYNVFDDGTVAGRKAVMGELNLYLDFINLLL